MEAGAIHIIGVHDAVESQLVLKKVSQEPGEASGGQGLPAGIIDPCPVMRVEPAVLMLIPIGLVHLVRTPDIHRCQVVPLGIRAGIEEECLVGPLGERVGIDQALRPGGLKAGDQGGRLLEQRLHLRIWKGQHPVEDPGDFWREIPLPHTRMPREQIPRHGGAMSESHREAPAEALRRLDDCRHGPRGPAYPGDPQLHGLCRRAPRDAVGVLHDHPPTASRREMRMYQLYG